MIVETHRKYQKLDKHVPKIGGKMSNGGKKLQGGKKLLSGGLKLS